MRATKFILIIGGGKIGSYLARELYSQGNEVVLIERDRVLAHSLSRSTGYSVINGDVEISASGSAACLIQKAPQ